MSNSLRDQLLGLGYKPPAEAPKPPRNEARPQGSERPRRDARPSGAERPGGDRPRGGERPGSAERPRGGQRPAGGAPARQGAPGNPGQRPDHRDQPNRGGPRPAASTAPRPAGRPAHRPAGGSEFDLGKAYALRAQTEKDERIAAEKAKQEEARLRREARAKLTVLLEGKALNDANAEHARHFEYGGKIKRVHVTPEQLAALNRGELGVLQSDGRYLLVSAEVLAQAEALFPPAIALKVDPNAPAEDDPYSNPAYQVPDDLIW